MIHVLTDWGWTKLSEISQIFPFSKCIFLKENVCFSNLLWNCCQMNVTGPYYLLLISQHWVSLTAVKSDFSRFLWQCFDEVASLMVAMAWCQFGDTSHFHDLGWVVHICISKLTIIGSDNDLSQGQCQTIIWTNAGILLIWPTGTNFNEILIEIPIFSFKKYIGKCWPFCLGLNV